MSVDVDQGRESGTRQRLLESACEVFSEKGFHDATIAEICESAGANIASVNYYFGSKEKLYFEVLGYAFRIANEQFPVDGGLPEDAPPEERLKSFVKAFLMRTFHGGIPTQFNRLVALEVSNPGSATEYLFQNVMRPQIEYLRRIVKDLLPDGVSERRRLVSGLGVISLCGFFNYNRMARERFMSEEGFSVDRVKWLADHITLFALAGIRAAVQSLPGDDDPHHDCWGKRS